MNDRDRLVELIRQVQYLGGLEEKLADHLLENGVTIPVRCKDCVNCEIVIDRFNNYWYFCGNTKNHAEVKKTDYCSYGKRKENDDE